MNTLYVFQKGFHYSQDGPGNRLVYHLSGCSLSCPWCSNPEGKERQQGKAYSLDELVTEAISAKPMFFEGGGVTLTGGEATEQFPAVKEFLTRLKDAGIHTCMETNGTHPRLPELSPLIDYLIMDVKHPADADHRRVIGISNRQILANLDTLGNRQLAVRIPLIGGFNDSPETAEAFAQLLKNRNITVELLRYHEYGRSKYEALGIPYPMTEKAYISDDTYHAFATILTQQGISLIHT